MIIDNSIDSHSFSLINTKIRTQFVQKAPNKKNEYITTTPKTHLELESKKLQGSFQRV